MPDVLAGYYTGYSDGYVDGLEDAVYYIIDLHHQGQDQQATDGTWHNEQMRHYREELRAHMRQGQRSGDKGSQTAGTRRITGFIRDRWVELTDGEEHQFAELESGRGVRFEVDLGATRELAKTRLHDNEQITVRASVDNADADSKLLKAHTIWLGNGTTLSVNAARGAGDAKPGAREGIHKAAATALPPGNNVPKSTVTQMAQAASAVAAATSEPQFAEHSMTVQLSRGPRGRAFLGVQLDQKVKDEVQVSHVYPESPAERAGLRVGDIILEVNGQEIGPAADLTELLSRLKPGQSAEVVVDRECANRGHDLHGRADSHAATVDRRGKSAAARPKASATETRPDLNRT